MKTLNFRQARHRLVFFLIACGAAVHMAYPTVVRADNQFLVKVQNSTVVVTFASEPTEELQKLALQWVARSAQAVASYYGRFPVKRVEVRVSWKDGQGIGSGQTFGGDVALIKISAGRSSTAASFSNDWEMTHEMTHLAFPAVARKHHWIEEGSATYVEPIARAQVGDLTPEKVWGDMMKGMRHGLPGAGDRGLDFTPTWGRTYWGGALFCLLADIEIRQRTKNAQGLEDALRAIVKAGGNITQEWELDRAWKIGDRAIGVPVLREMYDKWKAAPVTVDLNALWQELGVVRDERGIRFDDSAPLASIRRAITAPERSR